MKVSCSCLLICMSVSVLLVVSRSTTSVRGQEIAEPEVRAVEDSMHEFMEYLFQPTYVRLKAAIAREPANRDAWKSIKSDVLILAESTNLLMLRKPAENRRLWLSSAADVRESGGQLYQAAKKQDFVSARAAYEAMITRCNACHNEFAEGEHQLAP